MTLEGEDKGHAEESVHSDPNLDAATQELLKKEEQAKAEGKELSDAENEKLKLHRERSDLGRRFKEYREVADAKLEELSSKFDALLSTLQKGNQPIEERQPKYIATTEDLDEWDREKERKRIENQQRYEQSYAKTVMGLGKGNEEDIHDEVAKELLENINSPFNKMHTGNPILDAQLNYQAATVSVLRKKVSQKKTEPNVKGGKPPASTNLNVSSSQDGIIEKGIELDDFSRSYLKSIGKDEEWGKKAVSSK